MKPPLRIAILETDTPVPTVETKYGGYGFIFEKLLKSSAEALGRPDPNTGLKISKYQIELDSDNYPKLEDIDAILITGSSKSCRQWCHENRCL
jgi:hypothetical protein